MTGLAATTVAANPVEDIRITVRPRTEVRGRVRTAAGRALPRGLSVALVPQALEPSALYPAVEAPVDPEGHFRVNADSTPLRTIVRGLPQGWQAVTSSSEPLELIVAPVSSR